MENTALNLAKRLYHGTIGNVPFPLLLSLRNAYHHTDWGHKLIPLDLLKHRKLDPNMKVFELVDDQKLRFHNDQSAITKWVFWMGSKGYEANVRDLWNRCCAVSTEIVEIGANVGYFAVNGALANPQARYVAIEPHPTSASYLSRNASLNDCRNMDIIEAAITGENEPEYLELMVPDLDPDDTPTGAFLNGGESVNRGHCTPVKVKAYALSEVSKSADLIKLDVEGAEFQILKGYAEYLFANTPTLFIEVRRGTPKLRHFLHDLEQQAGYDIYALGEERLVKLNPSEIIDVVLQESYGTRDVVMVKDEKFQHVIDQFA